MAEVLLFHHVQGLTDGVIALADLLRDAGHDVHTPDLFDGRTFDTIEAGMAHAREVGFATLLDQGVALAQDMPTELVYAGMSMGVMPAQQLAQTRPGARAAVLLHSCIPVEEFSPTWPTGVPVQVHAMDGDPFFVEDGGDIDAARDLVAATDEAELFLYPGDAHLFTDSSLPAHDAAATDLLVARVLTFLDTLA